MPTPKWLGVVRLKPAASLQEALNEAFKDFKPLPICACNGETQCKNADPCDQYGACPDNPYEPGDERPTYAEYMRDFIPNRNEF